MKRSRSTRNGDKLTAEFTSGQLVIGIVCALFFCVACFMLGILVGKLDPSLQPGETALTAANSPTPSATAVTPPAATASTAATAPSTKTAVGVQQSPRTDGLRPHSTQPAKSTELPPLPGAAPVKIAKETPGATTRTRLDLPAGQATPPPATVAAPAAVPAAPGAAPAPAPAAPAATPPPAPLEPPAPATPVAMQAVDPPDAPATPAPAPAAAPAAPPAAPAKGSFAIQVASLMGANRDAGAAEFQKKFKKDTGLDCQAVPSANGGLRLMITGFASKEAANAANAEMKKKRPDLSGAFVVAQP
jgi:hypothetical protein